jgi:hypothetical protein
VTSVWSASAHQVGDSEEADTPLILHRIPILGERCGDGFRRTEFRECIAFGSLLGQAVLKATSDRINLMFARFVDEASLDGAMLPELALKATQKRVMGLRPHAGPSTTA